MKWCNFSRGNPLLRMTRIRHKTFFQQRVLPFMDMRRQEGSLKELVNSHLFFSTLASAHYLRNPTKQQAPKIELVDTIW